MAYRTGFSLHRAADGAFDGWILGDGPWRGAGRGRDAGFLAGVATSPETGAAFPFSSCVPSWNADTPAGSWLELELRVRSAGAWTPWRSLGVWASSSGTIKRHSVDGPDDGMTRVATDTLLVQSPADAFQARFGFFVEAGHGGTAPGTLAASMPKLRAFSLAYSDPKPDASTIVPTAPGEAPPAGARGLVLDGVPCRSQMVYPDGGTVWCSPTSVSMVLGYWRGEKGPSGDSVRAAVEGVYDHVYDGHGNWSFNAAYAGTQGMEACVARFSGLDRLEPWIAAGVPVVLSVSWNNDEGRMLSGAPVPRSSGHLTTLVGFDDDGNAVMNEPASPSDGTVRRVYDRRELEARWLSASGGVAYIIYPAGQGASARSRLFAATIGQP